MKLALSSCLSVRSSRGSPALQGPAESFGERALVENEPRSATITCVGKTEVLKLDRSAFTLLLGPLQEILKERVNDYTKKDQAVGNNLKGAVLDKDEPSPEEVKQAQKLAEQGDMAPMYTLTQDNYSLEELEVLGTLGNGSFGTVELVRDVPTGDTYALKIMNKTHVVKTRQQVRPSI